MENQKNPFLQENKKNHLTDRYKFIPTFEVKSLIEGQGMIPMSDTIMKVRKPENEGFQRHISRYDHPDWTLSDGKTKLQLLYETSHDGKRSTKFMLGLYELLCANGLIVGQTWSTFNIKHNQTDYIEMVKDSIKKVWELAPHLVKTVEELKRIDLSPEEVKNYAQNVFMERVRKNSPKEILLDPSLVRYRREEENNKAWTVLNVVQERAIRGGIHYIGQGEKENTHSLSRKVTSIQENVHMNKFCWDSMENMLKAA